MKKVFFVLLSLSLGCFAQNAASNSATTTAPQTATQSAAPAPPLVVPSNVALPGSGPPMGAPITNGNTNDSRTGGTVQVYNPATVLEHPVTTASGETANTTPAAPSEVPFNAGLQSFSGSAPPASQASASSLGDIARQYRGKQRQSARMFTNDSISQLSGGQSLPQGKEMSQASQPNVEREMAMAAAIPPMSASNASTLPQNDSASAGATQQSGRVDQQKRTSSNPASADQSAANTGSSNDQASASDDQSGSNSSRLPASGSELPLLALLGVAVASGGAIYRFRR